MVAPVCNAASDWPRTFFTPKVFLFSIIVTEEGNHRLSIFDQDGNCIHCFGSKGSANGQFSSPYGVAVSPKGRIYVSDRGNKKIQIFSNGLTK